MFSTRLIAVLAKVPNIPKALTQQQKPMSFYTYKRPPELVAKIGNREVVGYGFNGVECYIDRVDFPFPAIRFKEPSPEIMALREKERGDWRLLSIEEKKQLYRASFCSTFAEMNAPTGEWMYIMGWVLIFCSVALWLFIIMRETTYKQNRLPDSFTRPYKRAQLRRQIELRINPIFGLTSNWDYEKNDWKKKGWFTPENPYEGDDYCY